MYIQQKNPLSVECCRTMHTKFQIWKLSARVGWVGIKVVIVSFVRRTGPDMRRVEAASFDIVQVANYNLLVYHCAVPT